MWRFLVPAEKAILKWNDASLYVLATFLPVIPIFLSKHWGINHNVAIPLSFDQGKQTVCLGYWNRANWTSLVVFLPLALLILRWTANRLYPLGQWRGLNRISDRVAHKEKVGDALAEAAQDGRNLSAALLATVCIHIVDVGAIFRSYYLSFRGFHVDPPSVWDWSLWYLIDPLNRGLLYRNFILVIVAYLSQFLIVLLGMELISLLVRHNTFYLNLIYLRARAEGTDAGDFIVLDFESQNSKFGLESLSDQFNLQIKLLAIAGGLTLTSRIVNADTSKLLLILHNLPPDGFSKFIWQAFVAVSNNIGLLFPTYGQIMFPVGWFFMFLIVMLPARAKLLPLKVLPHAGGGKREYLLQFLQPGSKIDTETESLTKPGSVDATARIFAQHSFWPVGDTTAQYVSLIAFVVFFFMLAPVLPAHLLGLGILLFYLALSTVSYTCSQLLFWVFKYRLRAVDPVLVA